MEEWTNEVIRINKNERWDVAEVTQEVGSNTDRQTVSMERRKKIDKEKRIHEISPR